MHPLFYQALGLLGVNEDVLGESTTILHAIATVYMPCLWTRATHLDVIHLELIHASDLC